MDIMIRHFIVILFMEFIQNMVQSSIYVKSIVYYEISQENIEIGYGKFGEFWYYSTVESCIIWRINISSYTLK